MSSNSGLAVMNNGEDEFKKTANALGGGSGWVIFAQNAHTGGFHNYWSWDHMHNVPMGRPFACARYVRTRLPYGLRRRRSKICECLFAECELGRSQSPNGVAKGLSFCHHLDATVWKHIVARDTGFAALSLLVQNEPSQDAIGVNSVAFRNSPGSPRRIKPCRKLGAPLSPLQSSYIRCL